MNYFIFDFKKDSQYIDSFLESSALAHQFSEKKTADWFNWKFRDNPSGESILACAEQNGIIIGCVAYTPQDFNINGRKVKGALSFENFIHPSYQGKGIFSKLILLGEKEAKNRGIAFHLPFPNKKSLKGYLNKGWLQLVPPEYWISINPKLVLSSKIKDIRKNFKPNQSNISELSYNFDSFKQDRNENLNMTITNEYLQWRFFSYPVAEYYVINYKDVTSIIRLGKRGKLTEGQILFINSNLKKFNMREFIKTCKKNVNIDILSFNTSKTNPYRKKIKRSFFVKVPNRTNMCFKILDNSKITTEEIKKLSLSSINYHTY